MSDEQERPSKRRQDTKAGRDGYVAGRDMTVVYQHSDIRASTQDQTREDRDRAIVGQPISSVVDPYDLEVHPSISMPGSSASLSALPPYIPRAHDYALRQLIMTMGKRSAMAVLVGGSSTGKTRACWEAICTLPREWRVWHPVSPTRPEALWAALQEELIAPQTVIWLNETQYYLDTSQGDLGERIAASLRDLIRSTERGPVLVLGTLWPEYWELLTQRPPLGTEDSHAQARALLTTRRITVPERFEKQDLANLTSDAASDPRIIEAAKRQDGRLTQFLAGAFELLSRYELAPPEARAIITAAIDVRRFKHDIPADFLWAAAPGYVDDDTWNSLDDDWFEKGLKYATRRCLGVPGPLTRIRPRSGDLDSASVSYRLSDYLEQVGSAKRRYAVPPQTFWDAAAEFAPTIDDILDLAYEAQSRGRFRCAAGLYILAAQEGRLEALQYLSDYRRSANDLTAAEQLLREAAERGLSHAWIDLAEIQEKAGNTEVAEQLLEKVGPDVTALGKRARLRAKAGDVEGCRALLELAVGLGSADAMRELAQLLEDSSGDKARIIELRKKAAESESGTLKELRRAVRSLERFERRSARAADNFVRVASNSDETIQVIRELFKPDPEGESVSQTIILGRIEMNRGLVDQAKARFSRALDAGSMNERGQNFPLEMIAKIMREAGDGKTAERLLKYGMELDGTVAQPWTISMGT